jgi:hypothetical protein
MRAAGFLASVVLAVSISGCSEAGGGISEPATMIELATVVAPPQVIVAGTVLDPAPTVSVSAGGRPQQGVAVTMSLSRDDQVVAQRTVRTGADGIAQVADWRLTAAGTHTLTASAVGAADIAFELQVLPAPFARLAVVGGDMQRARAGSRVPQLLEVIATDEYGNAVAHVPVVFTVVAGGGTITADTVWTNGEGIARSGGWILGAADDTQRVVARSGGQEAVFTAELVATCAEPACPELAYTRDGAVIARNRDGSEYVVAADARNPAWSSDGSRIAFLRNLPDVHDIPQWQVCIASMFGTGVRCTQLDSESATSRPSWSPDDRRIAFSTIHIEQGWFAEYSGVRLLDVATMQIINLATPPVMSVAWSPIGQQIAFVSARPDAGGSRAIGLAYPDQPAPHMLGRIPQLSPSAVAWSSDGRQLLLALDVIDQCPWSCNTAIAIVDANLSNLQLLAEAEAEREWLGDPAWSPDGRIAFTRFSCAAGGGTCQPDVLIIRGVTGELEFRIQGAEMPSWRPPRSELSP